MKFRNKIYSPLPFGRLLSIALMVFCLTFLTSLNYFLYPDGQSAEKISQTDAKGSGKSTNKNFPPSGPTEEKTSGGSFSIIEEFLHDAHPLINLGVASASHDHQMEEAARILAFHGELVSPPPEL